MADQERLYPQLEIEDWKGMQDAICSNPDIFGMGVQEGQFWASLSREGVELTDVGDKINDMSSLNVKKPGEDDLLEGPEKLAFQAGRIVGYLTRVHASERSEHV